MDSYETILKKYLDVNNVEAKVAKLGEITQKLAQYALDCPDNLNRKLKEELPFRIRSDGKQLIHHNKDFYSIKELT